MRTMGKLCEKVGPAMVQRQGAELEVAEMMRDGMRDEGQHGGWFGDKARDYQTDLGRWY